MGERGDTSAATRLGGLLAALAVVGVVAGVLVGLLAAVATDGTSVSIGGPPATTDPEGGIPPEVVAPDARGPQGAGGEDGADGGAAGGSTLVAPVEVTTFDPQGDAAENDGQVALSWDGDPSTAWTTEVYSGPDLGGLKEGVGLVYDLGAPTAVSRVALQRTQDAPVTVYRADEVAPRLAGWTETGSEDGSGDAAEVALGQTARYWLVLVTDAPQDSAGSYQAGLAEVTFVR